MENKISLESLQIITNKLFDHIIKIRNVKYVELSSNYYWIVDNGQLYDINNEPSEFSIGSLVDDWEFLSQLTIQEALPVAYQLTELGPLLSFIGEILGKELAKQGG